MGEKQFHVPPPHNLNDLDRKNMFCKRTCGRGCRSSIFSRVHVRFRSIRSDGNTRRTNAASSLSKACCFRFPINDCIVHAIKCLRYVKFLELRRETIKRPVFIMSINVLLVLEWNKKCFNQLCAVLAHYREIHFFAHFPASLIDADTTATSEIFSKFHSSSQKRITNSPRRNFFVDTNVIALI